MAVNINVPSQVKTYANLAAFPATGALKTIYIAEDTNKTYRWTGSVYTEISASAAMTWGAIGGTLSNQTDLQSALDAKQDDITLTTTGSSGASTLVGSTLNVPNYTLSGLGGVPTSRTLTINGVTQDLSANRTFTISTGITIGSTAIASGVVGRVLFEGAGNVVQESSSLFWDSTNNRLGIGTSSPSNPLHLLSATNAAFFAKVQNTNGGSSASAGYEIQSNTAYGSIFATPSAYAPFGVLNASQIGFYSTNTFAIAIDSATSDFRIGTGLGATERMRIFANGNVLINTTTDSGFRLDVNGTLRSLGFTLRTSTADHYATAFSTTSTDGTFNFRRGADNGWVRFTLGASSQFFMSGETGTGELRVGAASGHFLTLYSGGSERIRLFNSTGNVGINTTTDAGFRLDVNGTARVQGDLTIQNNSSLSWGNGNFVQVNNANPDWKFYVQSSLILTLSNTQLTFGLAARTRDLIASSDASLDIGQQFSRYRNGWLSGQLKVGDATAVNASAKVQIDSTSQGFLPPRMTTTQKNAIASPAAGLMVYDTTLNVISYYNGSMWI